MDTEKGASSNELLINAARTDNKELAESVIEREDCDINFQDGLGNTALHWAVQHGSTEVLDLLLETEGCDVDIQNRVLKATPLHLAVKLSDLDLRHYVVRSLLDAGADITIRDKYGQLASQLVPADDDACRGFIREAQAQAAQANDVASDSDDEGAHSDDVASD
ncbi:ankyrin [Serendipita vermifera]|nr:ankyrin [Serendipita vermifera]